MSLWSWEAPVARPEERRGSDATVSQENGLAKQDAGPHPKVFPPGGVATSRPPLLFPSRAARLTADGGLADPRALLPETATMTLECTQRNRAAL